MYPIDSIVLYVEDIGRSKVFYADVLSCEVEELSPTFISIGIEGSTKLELKQRAQAIPPATFTGGGAELSIRVPDTRTLHGLYEQWKNKGVRFAQEPTELVFGLTFVALDPDEHRIRVYVQK